MKFYITLTVLFIFFVQSYSTFAQKKDRFNLTFKADAGGFYQTGNTDKFYTASTGEIKVTKGIVESILTASLDYGETDKIKDENNFISSLTFDMWYDNIWSPFFLQYGEFSFARNISFRSQTGAGIKYTFLPQADYRTSLSGAGIYDYTNYNELSGYEDKKTTRLSFRFKSKILVYGGFIAFTHITFFQPNVKELRDRIWKTETIFEVKPADEFYLFTSYKYNYEYYTTAGSKNHDHKIAFGIGIEYK
jgi:hypothetical protein